MVQRQLHAGQLRFHDFAPLRAANALRHRPNVLRGHASPLLLQPNSPISLPLSWSITHPQPQHRTLFTNSSSRLLSDVQLKFLEKSANANASDPSSQLKFLQKLNVNYPEMVVQRFESSQFQNLHFNEQCALEYIHALGRLNGGNGGMEQFHLQKLISRLSMSGAVNAGTLQALSAINSPQTNIQSIDEQVKRKKMLSKSEQAMMAMSVLSGGGLGAVMNPAAFAGRSGIQSLGAAGSQIGFGGYGTDPTRPLHVAIDPSQAGGFRTQMFKLARSGLYIFFALSLVGAVLDEKGLSRVMGGASKVVQEAEETNVRFEDVKGVEEAKNELVEIVEYLKNPEKFTRLGGKLPRGLLLTGPPGTGKTLLAKAIAGEADVPFFYSSGSQFEEMYVGVGAKRVRELFEAAKEKSPCIIFIDEIDAVGGSRKLKDQSALKQTLNELLVQMDGFDDNNGIIIIGATNFKESLDSALMRPGRFDKQVSVPLPDIAGRKAILEMYAKKTKLSKDVDLNVLARGTTGFSGAELYNLMNQAALKASVDGLNSITMHVFEYAKDKIMMGAERKSAVITPETARFTAFHEAGHALVSVLSDGADPIHKATIMPRGDSLGMVTMLPDGDQTSRSLKQLLAYMDVVMGGRVAEEIIFGKDNVTTGAYSDIIQATRTARNMVTKYGFSNEVGIVHHGGETGKDSASGATQAKIDAEVKMLTDQAYTRATELLKKHSKRHHLLAETLLEFETLTGDEVRDVVLKGMKPKRPIINEEGGAKGDQNIFNGGNKTSKTGLLGVGSKIGYRSERS
eukprot:CAMPEP_0194442990 /NCGR_PEP_ID=MMETSP0176-20130528/126443_1 /TAXON_ID=216777 /ORGANISM="Proboscia alata, Strain PI-D3" /LENGTH=793 /DNA_ID=CAMNT_0039269165 /DNA_START=67 /DNA_END=2451 /DNA_ORIENTATION=+